MKSLPSQPAAPHAPTAREVSLRWRLLPLGLLALLLGVATVGWLTRSRGPGGTRTERMEAALRDLAARDAETFAGVTLVPRSALDAARPRTGHGLRVVAPQGAVLDLRPRTRWAGVPLDAQVEVTMRYEGGPVLWKASGQARFLTYPPDQPPLQAGGTYQVALRIGPEGAPTSAMFWVVPASSDRGQPAQLDRRRWDDAGATIREHAPADLRTLLLAHVAAHMEYLLEAERLAQEALREDARNDDALLLLRWVHAQLGESEGYESAR